LLPDCLIFVFSLTPDIYHATPSNSPCRNHWRSPNSQLSFARSLIKEFFHEAMEEVRKVSKLNVCPGYRPLRIIEKGLSQKLPENSHQLASGKLCISVTRLLDLQNVIISEYRSKEELIQVTVALFPMYLEEGERYIDGGISNVQPGSDSETMITVSPYTGEVDICPRDCPAYFNCISFFQSTFQLSVENVCRFSYSIFPPSPPVSSLRDCTVPDHFSIANPKHVRTINQPPAQIRRLLKYHVP
uniref:Adipose triglyceride lipase n=1 Tax=Chelydra serpentina TaxID=8475 RepID=A0A8C3T9E4_CHESE